MSRQVACKLCGAPFVCDNGMWFTSCECARSQQESARKATGMSQEEYHVLADLLSWLKWRSGRSAGGVEKLKRRAELRRAAGNDTRADDTLKAAEKRHVAAEKTARQIEVIAALLDREGAGHA